MRADWWRAVKEYAESLPYVFTPAVYANMKAAETRLSIMQRVKRDVEEKGYERARELWGKAADQFVFKPREASMNEDNSTPTKESITRKLIDTKLNELHEEEGRLRREIDDVVMRLAHLHTNRAEVQAELHALTTGSVVNWKDGEKASGPLGPRMNVLGEAYPSQLSWKHSSRCALLRGEMQCDCGLSAALYEAATSKNFGGGFIK